MRRLRRDGDLTIAVRARRFRSCGGLLADRRHTAWHRTGLMNRWQWQGAATANADPERRGKHPSTSEGVTSSRWLLSRRPRRSRRPCDAPSPIKRRPRRPTARPAANVLSSQVRTFVSSTGYRHGRRESTAEFNGQGRTLREQGTNLPRAVMKDRSPALSIHRFLTGSEQRQTREIAEGTYEPTFNRPPRPNPPLTSCAL